MQTRKWLLVPLLAGLLAACSSAANPIIPVLNPQITPVLGQVPPQASPTPDLNPQGQLSAAKLLLHNGDYENALQAFHQLTLDPNVAPNIMAEASLGVARAALEQGSFGAAQTAFDNYLNAFPDHPQSASALFLRGDAKMGVGDWAGAVVDFQQYLSARPGLADSYVYERIADAQLALNQNEQALASYQQATAAGRDVVSSVELREKVAQVYLNAGNPQGAIEQYNAILNVARIPSYRAKIDLLLADAYFAAGDSESGNTQLLYITETYSDFDQSYNALQTLDLAGQTAAVDLFQRALIQFNGGAYDLAAQSFYDWLALADPNHPADAHLYVARSYAALGNAPTALTEYQTIIDTHPNDPQWEQAFLEYAGVQADTGDIDGALATLNSFINDNPDSAQTVEALVQAAELAEDIDNIQLARDFYLRLGTIAPGDERAIEGLLQAAVDNFQQNDLNNAELILSSITSNAQGRQLATANLWLGRVYIAQGKTEDAARVLASATAAEPGGYYAIRATDLQDNRPLFMPPNAITFEFDEAADQAAAETWLQTTFTLEQAPPYLTLRPDIATDGRMVRGQELWSLGLLEEGRLEFESLRSDLDTDPLGTYQLALFFRDIGLYRASINATQNLIKLSGQTPLTVPRFIARLSYPTYYSDLVLTSAEQYGFDPLFLFAVIRQESAFEGFVTSFAFAQGLMQVTPPTGEEIATNLNWPDYQNEDLYRPYVSVQFGTYYMSRQRAFLDGDTFAALAAYNAGPGRALQWKNVTGDDPDLFVESIPFDETYRYVTSIYVQYDIYRKLYGIDS